MKPARAARKSFGTRLGLRRAGEDKSHRNQPCNKVAQTYRPLHGEHGHGVLQRDEAAAPGNRLRSDRDRRRLRGGRDRNRWRDGRDRNRRRGGRTGRRCRRRSCEALAALLGRFAAHEGAEVLLVRQFPLEAWVRRRDDSRGDQQPGKPGDRPQRLLASEDGQERDDAGADDDRRQAFGPYPVGQAARRAGERKKPEPAPDQSFGDQPSRQEIKEQVRRVAHGIRGAFAENRQDREEDRRNAGHAVVERAADKAPEHEHVQEAEQHHRRPRGPDPRAEIIRRPEQADDAPGRQDQRRVAGMLDRFADRLDG